MTSGRPGLGRAAGQLLTRTVAIGVCAAALLAVTIPVPPVPINVRWRAGVTADQRAGFERRFGLAAPRHDAGQTWGYDLTDPSGANIRALIEHPAVEDTANLHRTAFRPPLARYRPWLIATRAAAAGAVLALCSLLLPVMRPLAARPVVLGERPVVRLVGAAPAALIIAGLAFTLAAAADLL